MALIRIPKPVELPIVITNNWSIASYVKGCHVYQSLWKPILNEILTSKRQPENPVDKYAVCVLKDAEVVGHLTKGCNGRFAKTVSFFLKGDPHAKCDVRITGKPLNLGDGEGMQVPCLLEFQGQCKFLKVLKKNL